MDAKDLLLRTDCLFVKANGSVVSTQTHMDKHTTKPPEILSWSDQCNTHQVFAEFRSQINEMLKLVTHHYWAMNPNTAAVSVEVGWHQSWIRVCVKVWASHPAIHLLSKHVSPVRPHHCCIHWGSPVTRDDTHVESKVFARMTVCIVSLYRWFDTIMLTYTDKLSLQDWDQCF